MDDEWELIQKALENSDYKWRTLDGVAKETGLDNVTVVSSMSNHSDLVIQSSIPSKTGAELFTTRNHYKEKSSVIDRILNSVTNKVE